jgi:predicted glycoside hydrolase/deacetylase ChbG (UPF0249 family)
MALMASGARDRAAEEAGGGTSDPLPARADLLVTADDFGLCPQIDEAVCLLHDRGIVHRTSFITGRRGFDRSVERLAARSGLQVGVHLNLTDGRPVLPPRRVPSLVTGTGEFVGGRHYRVLANVVAGWSTPADIRSEWRAQLARARGAGLRITHLDSHGHLHLLPAVREIVLDLLEEFEVPFVRLLLSADSARYLPFRPGSAGRAAGIGRRGLAVRYPRRVIGLRRRGTLDLSRLLDELRAQTGGVTELIVHPSIGSNEYHARWGYAGRGELDSLLAPEIARVLTGRAG